jgi:serine phosphatase RsbU (regulator of sigma subunit)
MVKIKLKKVLLKDEVLEFIHSFVKIMDIPLYIEDDRGTSLIDIGGNKQRNRYPVEIEGNIIGWVIGDDRVLPIVSLLNSLVEIEYDKKILARETLEKYREINLLYNISEKISSCLYLEEISGLVIEEVKRLISYSSTGEGSATSGALLLLNDNTGRLELLKGFGKTNYPNMSFTPGEGIIGDVVLTGEGEIINDLISDPRFIKGDCDISSMICVPLKTKNRVIGGICVCSREPVTYSSEDKKRLTMLALYTASAIENAQLYNTLEQKVKDRTRELAEKNKQIMDSIDYAEGIQRAILPLSKKIKEALPEHFILYKPKDIISGDIYWFHLLGDKIFIAAIDCTGHGVPGALLSMMGNSILNELVKERHISDPALILQGLHNEVCRALKQGECTDSLDGMDVALCVIEKNKNKITFAGARRPLYLVPCADSPADPQNRENECIIIKGDRKSIGGRQREKERIFTNQEIEIRAGDMIYLTTDGFSDQNNTEGQKYGSQRLLAFLPMIAKLPLSSQQQYFEEELSDFMGEEEQRDDITVIGVRMQ